MDKRYLSEGQTAAFARALRAAERSPGTIKKYLRDVCQFAAWAGGGEVSRERTAAWRDSLLEGGYAPATVNSMVAAVNQFFTFLGWEECKVKALKIQRKLFRDDRRELNREEYQRLLDAAHGLGRERLALLLETICATGIRVSEVKYITVEAARAGRAEVSLKGKLRTILLPGKLCRKLKKFVQTADLGGDEAAVQVGRGGPQQGVPPQPAAPVRPDFLQGVPGRGKAGRRAGAQQRGDHPHLPDLHRRGARGNFKENAPHPIKTK